MAISGTDIRELTDNGLAESAGLISRREYNLSIVRSRQTAEFLIKSYAAEKGVAYTSLADTIETLYEQGIINRDSRDAFHNIRIYGNKAVHDGDNDPEDAQKTYYMLKNEVGTFLSRKTVSVDRTPVRLDNGSEVGRGLSGIEVEIDNNQGDAASSDTDTSSGTAGRSYNDDDDGGYDGASGSGRNSRSGRGYDESDYERGLRYAEGAGDYELGYDDKDGSGSNRTRRHSGNDSDGGRDGYGTRRSGSRDGRNGLSSRNVRNGSGRDTRKGSSRDGQGSGNGRDGRRRYGDDDRRSGRDNERRSGKRGSDASRRDDERRRSSDGRRLTSRDGQRRNRDDRRRRNDRQESSSFTVYDLLRILLPVLVIILLIVIIRSFMSGKSQDESMAETTSAIETMAPETSTEPETSETEATEPETTEPETTAAVEYRIADDGVNVRFADNQNRIYTQLSKGTAIGTVTAIEGSDYVAFTLDGVNVVVRKDLIEPIQ